MLLPFSYLFMRLDLFLKASRLIVRRSLAQKFCDANLVEVNGLKAKSSRDIRLGDEILIKRHNRLTKIRVLDIPEKKQVSRSNSGNLYEILVDKEIIQDVFE